MADRITKIARGVALLAQLGDEEPPKRWSELNEQDKSDAKLIAQAIVDIWEGLNNG